mgnify:CR=1 FL=1
MSQSSSKPTKSVQKNSSRLYADSSLPKIINSSSNVDLPPYNNGDKKESYRKLKNKTSLDQKQELISLTKLNGRTT